MTKTNKSNTEELEEILVDADVPEFDEPDFDILDNIEDVTVDENLLELDDDISDEEILEAEDKKEVNEEELGKIDQNFIDKTLKDEKKLVEKEDVLVIDDSDDMVPEVSTAGVATDSIRDYLKQIGRVPLLTAEQEIEFAKQIEAGLYAEKLLEMDENFEEGKKRAKEIAAEAAKENSENADGKITHEIEDQSEVDDLDIEKTKNNKVIPNTIQWPKKRLTFKEKRALKRIATNGKKVKNHMLEANLRLVVSIAKRYTGRGTLFLDLVQEGNMGLIRATEKFDYKRGFKFSTYAHCWIRQSITRAMADQSRTIRIPVHMVEIINKVSRIQRQLVQELGREPSPDEIAKEVDMPVSKVIEAQKYGKDPISLHTSLGEEGDSEFGDLIEDNEAINPSEAVDFDMLKESIRQTLDTLSDREAGVIKMRYGLDNGRPRTLDEIGNAFNVTRERIRQIEKKTMAKLYHPSRKMLLKDFVD